jgi:uncharacterized protein YndB with AHSA1/START domain
MNPSENVVSKVVTVNAPIAHVFDVFTRRFDTWWPRTHKIGKAELKEAIIEGKEGGRWYERDVDGSECDWGRVLVYSPPSRIALSWHLNGNFQYDPDPARASRVDVFFHDEGGRTRVELVHSGFERHGESGQRVKERVAAPGGWGSILDGFATSVAA